MNELLAFLAAMGAVACLVAISSAVSDLRRIMRDARRANLPPPKGDSRDQMAAWWRRVNKRV